MACLRATVLATAVGLMALATRAACALAAVQSIAATARDCPGWAAASCVSVANLQRARSPAHRE